LAGAYMLAALIIVEGFVSWLLFRMGVVALLMIASTVFGLVLIDAALCALPAGYVSAKIVWKGEEPMPLVQVSLSAILCVALFLAVLLFVLATHWIMFAVVVRSVPLSVAIVVGAYVAVLSTRRNIAGRSA